MVLGLQWFNVRANPGVTTPILYRILNPFASLFFLGRSAAESESKSVLEGSSTPPNEF